VTVSLRVGREGGAERLAELGDVVGNGVQQKELGSAGRTLVHHLDNGPSQVVGHRRRV